MSAGAPTGSEGSQPKQAATLVLGTTASTLAEVLTPLLLVRLISKADLGILTSLLLIFTTAVTIAAVGFPRAIMYFLPNRSRAERGVIARRVGLLLLLLGLLGGALLLALEALAEPATRLAGALFGGAAGAPSVGDDARASPYLWLVAIYVALELPTRMLTNLLIVEGRARAAAGTALLKSLGVAVATLVPSALGVGIEGILLSIVAFAVLYLGLFVACLVGLYRGADGGLQETSVTYRELVTFSIPLGLTDIVGVLSAGLDRYMVMFFFTAAAFAEYQIGAWKIPIISAVAYAVGNVYMPQFKRAYDEQRQREAIDIWRRSIVKVTLVVAPVTTAFFVAAEELVTVFFTDEYLGAVPIFRWYALLTLGRVAQYGAPILAAGRPRYILYASLFTLLSNFVISLPLVLLVGFQGPAMGTAIAFIPTVVFYCWFVAKASGIGFSETFPLVAYLRVVAVGAVAGAVGWALKVTVDLPPAVMLPLLCLVVCGGFGLLGTALRLITREDWRFALDFVRLRVLR